MTEFVLYPGFLGQRSDFTALSHALGSVHVVDPAVSYGLASFKEISEIGPELLWPTPKKGKRIGIGYSMGGRLLLQLAQKFPEHFDGLVFISTNPGLISEKEKITRLKSDSEWATKVQNQSWADFLGEWNLQSVFQGSSSELDRNEESYDKAALSRQLINWSLAKQQDFRFYLRVVSTPYLWITGERDRKFSEMAEEILPLDFLPIHGAGHRVHLDQPAELARVILKLADKINRS